MPTTDSNEEKQVISDSKSTKRTVKCEHSDDVSKCPPCWARSNGDRSVEQKVDEIFEDLIVGHNFDYAANKIKSIIGRERIEATVSELQREQKQNYEAKRSRRISELQDILTLGSDYEAQGHLFDYRKAVEHYE